MFYSSEWESVKMFCSSACENAKMCYSSACRSVKMFYSSACESAKMFYSSTYESVKMFYSSAYERVKMFYYSAYESVMFYSSVCESCHEKPPPVVDAQNYDIRVRPRKKMMRISQAVRSRWENLWKQATLVLSGAGGKTVRNQLLCFVGCISQCHPWTVKKYTENCFIFLILRWNWWIKHWKVEVNSKVFCLTCFYDLRIMTYK